MKPLAPDDWHAPDGGGPFVTAVLQRALVSGTCASIASTGRIGLAGVRDCASAMAPTNAVRHWIWGDRALRQQSIVGGLHRDGVCHSIMRCPCVLALRIRGLYRVATVPATHGYALGAALATSAIAALVDPEIHAEAADAGLRAQALFPHAVGCLYRLRRGAELRQLFASKHRDG